MELNYRILWFEDTEESFESLSRQTIRYVERKNLYCIINRIMGLSDFDMSVYDINSYDLLVVDLKLANGSSGYEIISKIRNSGFVNDILFYSSVGMSALKEALREYELEGVFLSERAARIFMDNIQKLIDKSIKRSENVINIRGIVMDETSGYDNQMTEIVLKLIEKLSVDQTEEIKKYVRKDLLENQLKSSQKLLDSFPLEDEWSYEKLFENHSFSSIMMARLLNRIINIKGNDTVESVARNGITILPDLYSNDKVHFVENYTRDILYFRNQLAHVKAIDSEHPPIICERDGIVYKCDENFCDMMRKSLIKYGAWLKALCQAIEKQNSSLA